MKINHKNLDSLLGKILGAHASGHVSQGAAIGAIAHVIAAIAKGNEAEATAWINDPAAFDRWLSGAR